MNRYRVKGRVRHVEYDYEVRAWSADDAVSQVRIGFVRTSRYQDGAVVDDVLTIVHVEPVDVDEEVDRLREELQEAQGIIAGLKDALAGRVKPLEEVRGEVT